MTEYKEKVTCNKCSTIQEREIESIEITNNYLNIKKPFKCLIIKKFICPECGDSENYSIEIIKDELKREKAV
ncbi:MAG: hypothetical protein ACOCP8_04880 [archaeon]